MKLKRFLSVLLVFFMIFGLTACSGNADPINNGKHDSEAQEKDEDRDEDNDDVIEAVPDQTQDDPSLENQSKNYEADWDGVWLPLDSYIGVEKLVVEPSKDGVAFHLYYDGTVRDYSGKEEEYKLYDEGSCISANVISDDVCFEYSAHSDGNSRIDLYGFKNANGVSIIYSFYKFTGNWKEAPAEYDYSNCLGLINRNDPDDSQYFYADTDDYIIQYYKDCFDFLGNIHVDEMYTIYSFDKNGVETGRRKQKAIFENSEEASEAYSRLPGHAAPDHFCECVLLENIIYFISSEAYSNSSKLGLVYPVMYTDVNYLYYETGNIIYYLSKPISTDLFNLSLDDIVYYNKIKGSHYCTDNKDIFINIRIERGGIDATIKDRSDDPMHSYTSFAITRIDGRKIYVISYVYSHKNIAGSDYRTAVTITEYEFDDDKAVVTCNIFPVDDPRNSGITLDNYKTLTAEKTITHTFDMTSKK